MSAWTQADVDRINAVRGAAMPAHVSVKRAKFGNKKKLVDGIVFASGHEANRYIELKTMQAAGLIRALELQPKFAIFACELSTGNGIEVASYKADFRYFDVQTQRVRIEDAKSSGTDEDTAYRLRKKLVEACHSIAIEEV